MKIYTKEILTCHSCPMLRYHELGHVDYCLQVNKVIESKFHIPKWCPLPDKREEKRK